MKPTSLHITLFIITTTSIITLSFSDPRIAQSFLCCSNTTTKRANISSNLTSLIPTFVKAMGLLSQVLTSATRHRNFATYTYNNSPSFTMYALTQCNNDLSQTDCVLCYATARTKLPRCLPSLSASIFLDGCFLRYDTYRFFEEAVSSSLERVKCEGDEVVGSERSELMRSVRYGVGNVSEVAVEDGGFGVFEIGGVYVLAQCWESVGRDGCRVCLERVKKDLKVCEGKKEGRVMNAGCYLRYSTYNFYNDQDDLNQGHGFAGLGLTIGIVLATALFLMLALFATYASYLRLCRSRKDCSNLAKISISFNKSGLNVKYETLEKATDYFNQSRKLGQGGAGSVFMGTLPGGQTVAVKRLIFNTRQWVDDFFNEVNLISGIQHKNLVKLLGCSIEGPESLLVYEYVPNKSLDQFLFGKSRGETLNWKPRFDIIVGTAEGLAYLHGGAEGRIIHRDIKSSNILLDENLTPKIADFGLVRCLGAEKSHLSTGIAGTLGYMAPEYLVQGKLTDKADVYSFGVLVLEIVSGKRCNTIVEDSGSVLQKVWQLFRSGRVVEIVDPSIGHDFPAQEASHVLQIGLLCTQASVSLRPSMEQVVKMLTDSNAVIPVPRQPPFINATMMDPVSSLRSYSTNSFESNAATKLAASYTSTESSSFQSSNNRPSRSDELVLRVDTS